MFVSVSKGHFVRSDLVISVIPAHTKPAKKIREAAKKDGTLINLKGGNVIIKGMLLMTTGDVVLIPLTPQKFVNLCEVRQGIKDVVHSPSKFYNLKDVEDSDVSLESHITEKLKEL